MSNSSIVNFEICRKAMTNERCNELDKMKAEVKRLRNGRDKARAEAQRLREERDQARRERDQAKREFITLAMKKLGK